jgi:hypothetical protein
MEKTRARVNHHHVNHENPVILSNNNLPHYARLINIRPYLQSLQNTGDTTIDVCAQRN